MREMIVENRPKLTDEQREHLKNVKVQEITIKDTPENRKKAAMVLGGIAALLLLVIAVVAFAVLPSFQNGVQDALTDGLATQVAKQIGPISARPGTYTIALDDVQTALATDLEAKNISDVEISSGNGEITFRMTTRGKSFSYSGTPTVKDGALVMDDMTSDSGALGFLLPADKVGTAIEKSVNEFFDSQRLTLTSVSVKDNTVVLEAVAK